MREFGPHRSLPAITGDQETTSPGTGTGAGTRAARAARSAERGAGEEEPRWGEGPMPPAVTLNAKPLVLFRRPQSLASAEFVRAARFTPLGLGQPWTHPAAPAVLPICTKGGLNPGACGMWQEIHKDSVPWEKAAH